MDDKAFRSLLIALHKGIREEFLSELIERCEIPPCVQHRMRTPLDVLVYAKGRGDFSATNTEPLKALMKEMEFGELVARVDTFENARALPSPSPALDEGVEGMLRSCSSSVTVKELHMILGQCEAVVRIKTEMLYGSGFYATWGGHTLLVTSRHVLPSADVAAKATVQERYFSMFDDCPEVPLAPVAKSLLVGEGALDVAVMRLDGPKENSFELCWLDGSTKAESLSLHTVHHPMGSHMKIDAGVTGARSEGSNGMYLYLKSNTEEGSSGSPIFACVQGKPRLIAVHTGWKHNENYGILVDNVCSWLEQPRQTERLQQL